MKEAYSFTKGFSGYHQIKFSKEDRHKTKFAIEWGSFQYTTMPFSLKNALVIFSKVVVDEFKDFIHKFLEVYLYEWIVFNPLNKHVQKLRLMLDMCRQLQISLNMRKFILCSPFRVLLGHNVHKDGLIVDPTKVIVIVYLATPTNVK